MGFFVPAQINKEKEENKESEGLITERLDLFILVNAKKQGLSFLELNEFRVRDYIEFSDIYAGKVNKTKIAKQEDIDDFLG